MNSKAYLSPLVQNIVLSAIRNVKQRDTTLRPSYKINADLVPRISEKVLTKNNMQESILIQTTQESRPQIDQKVSQVAQRPVQVQQRNLAQQIPAQMQPMQEPDFQEMAPKPSTVAPVSSSISISLNSIYKGKLAGLINDPSVLSIECLGQGIPLTIFRAGQKQRTKIALTKPEIENMLNEISSQTKIPLGEGVFKVIVNNLMINAIVSELIGTRFVIKKLFQMNSR